jgi:phosphoribosylanthranilate isomerase
VKICGITGQEDALTAIRAGADAIGFVFWPGSPRVIPAAAAASIARGVAIVARVGVFVNSSPDSVASIVREAGLDAVQLHGDERPADYLGCGAPVIKVIRVSTDADVERALAIDPGVTLLIDAIDSERRGGTGQLANWRLAGRVAQARPVMLAGGLTPANVGEAIAEVHPWAIDVSSGVERAPGQKDPAAIAAFCAAVRRADAEVS